MADSKSSGNPLPGGERVRSALKLRRIARRMAWEGAKLAFALGVRAGVRRLRAGPLVVQMSAPVTARVGDTFALEAEIETPHALVEARAYFGGIWVAAKRTSPGLHREVWWFRATTPGLRPILLHLKDAEGHTQTATRWIWVKAEDATAPQPSPVRVGSSVTDETLTHPVESRNV